MGYNKEGLTLVEVLVSVVITILVMMYGVTIFVASWKLEVDSAEYLKVLQHMSNTLEQYKSYANIIDKYDGKYKVIEDIPEIELPSKKIVVQKLIMYNMGTFANKDKSGSCPGAIPVTIVATWPKNPTAFQKKERIVINTYFFKNMESYFKSNYNSQIKNEFKEK